jgi:hypothetical protein
MFLYVKIIFRILYYINDIGDIQNQLEHLPSSLEDAYELCSPICCTANICLVMVEFCSILMPLQTPKEETLLA